MKLEKHAQNYIDIKIFKQTMQLILEINLFYIFLSLFVINVAKCQERPTFVCANSFDDEYRTEEIVRCITFDGLISISLDCKLTQDFKLQKVTKRDVIEARLVLTPPQNNANESIFEWEQETSSESNRNFFLKNSKDELINKKSVALSINSDNQSFSEIILYNFKFDILYKICVEVLYYIYIMLYEIIL